MASLTLKTAPTTEPVTTAVAKSHLFVEHTNDDTYIGGLITVARRMVESFLNRQLITATWEYRMDGEFPTEIRLPRPPLSAVNSVKYVDSNGDTQTLTSSTYQVDVYSVPGRVKTAYGQTWPTVRSDTYNTIVVDYNAGYGTAATNVPDEIRHAISMAVAEWYEHRLPADKVESLPAGVKLMLWPHRCAWFEGFQGG